MRVLFIAEGAIERGRGPLTRFLGALPWLARSHEMHSAFLGPIEGECREIVDAHCVRSFVLPIVFDGWFVTNAAEIATTVQTLAGQLDIDIVLLSWEIWDLMDSIGRALRARFANYVHSTPFLDAPVRPTRSFERDLRRRLRSERDPAAAHYCTERAHTVRAVLERTQVLSVNETVDFYLQRYFPWLRIIPVRPSYAVALAREPKRDPTGDAELVYTAKLGSSIMIASCLVRAETNDRSPFIQRTRKSAHLTLLLSASSASLVERQKRRWMH